MEVEEVPTFLGMWECGAEVKGKGEMLTYWVESKANRIPPTQEEVRRGLVS